MKDLAPHQLDIIYGGASIGIMGELADACVEEKLKVIGVIPSLILEREFGHDKIHQLIEVDSMHARKEKIYELSDAMLVLPGGFGTLDEAFEFITWNQLDIHDKKIAFLNWDRFFDPIIEFCKRAEEERFIKVYDQTEPKFFNETQSMLDWILC